MRPRRVLSKLYRVLKPGGRISAYSAFLHRCEARHLIFSIAPATVCANGSEISRSTLCVFPTGFARNSEAEATLRRDFSDESANAFLASCGDALVNPCPRSVSAHSPIWTNFYKVPEPGREATAAGFELLGREPLNVPDLTVQSGGARRQSHTP
jgi:hypothetical protein